MIDKNGMDDNKKKGLTNFTTFAKYAKLILKDMNRFDAHMDFFKKYDRKNVVRWLESPKRFQKKIVEISKYCYMISPHYRRICDYFSKMSLLSYVVIPYKVDIANFNKTQFLSDYKITIDKLQVMNIKNEYSKIITEMFVSDIAYVYRYSTPDSYFLKLLPFDRCEISSIVDGVFQFQFDFEYFDLYPKELDNYGDEFIKKYKIYKNDKTHFRWQQLDDNKSFALKLSDNVSYAIPIFSNLILTIFDLEELRQIEKAKNKLNVYKLLLMRLPMDEDGNFIGDFDKSKEYFNFLCECVDDTVAVGMSPYDVKDFSFEQSGTSNQINAYSDSVSEFFTSAGVSELLFNSSKSSSATISSSIKNDSEMVSYIHRMIERVINKQLKQEITDNKFLVKILDVTTYNQQDYIDNLLKSCTVGSPVKLEIPACFGYTPSEVYGSQILEDCLDIVNKWKPLSTSYVQSGKDNTGTKGRPVEIDSENENTIQSRENDNRNKNA